MILTNDHIHLLTDPQFHYHDHDLEHHDYEHKHTEDHNQLEYEPIDIDQYEHDNKTFDTNFHLLCTADAVPVDTTESELVDTKLEPANSININNTPFSPIEVAPINHPTNVTLNVTAGTAVSANAGVATGGAVVVTENLTAVVGLADTQPNQCREAAANQCRWCPERFSRRFRLEEHERQHTGEKPYQCDKCEVKFVKQSSFRLHQRLHEGASDSIICPQCNKRFARQTDLKAHQVVHSGDKPFECQYCRKHFAYKRSLRAHIQDRCQSIPPASSSSTSVSMSSSSVH